MGPLSASARACLVQVGFALEEVAGASLGLLSPVRSAEIRSGLALLATAVLCGFARVRPPPVAEVAGALTSPLLPPPD